MPLTGAEIRKIGKRGFGVTPIPHHPRKGRSESKNPHFYTEHYKEKGEFSTRSPLFWGGGKRGFFYRAKLCTPPPLKRPFQGWGVYAGGGLEIYTPPSNETPLLAKKWGGGGRIHNFSPEIFDSETLFSRFWGFRPL